MLIAEDIRIGGHPVLTPSRRERLSARLGHLKQLPVRVMPCVSRLIVGRGWQRSVWIAGAPILLALQSIAVTTRTVFDVYVFSRRN